jgi:hypothetical protein
VINFIDFFQASGYGTALYSTLNSSFLKFQNPPSFSQQQFSDLRDAKQIRQLKIQAIKVRFLFDFHFLKIFF